MKPENVFSCHKDIIVHIVTHFHTVLVDACPASPASEVL